MFRSRPVRKNAIRPLLLKTMAMLSGARNRSWAGTPIRNRIEETMFSSRSWKVIIRRAAAVVWGVAIIGFGSAIAFTSLAATEFGGCNANPEWGCASVYGAWENKSCASSGGACQTCRASTPDVCFPNSEQCQAESCVLDGYKSS